MEYRKLGKIKMTICPYCGGSGKRGKHRWISDSDYKPKLRRCDACDGSGKYPMIREGKVVNEETEL